jgi:hypothetical protein
VTELKSLGYFNSHHPSITNNSQKQYPRKSSAILTSRASGANKENESDNCNIAKEIKLKQL